MGDVREGGREGGISSGSAVGVEGHKQGGPPVKEVLLLSRGFYCQGGWHREEEGEKDRGREGSECGGSNVEGDKLKEVLLSKEVLILRIHVVLFCESRILVCESIFLANPGYFL